MSILKMNRRTFLKSIATVCGAAVVCPGELLEYDPWIRAAALRKKNAAMGFPTFAKQPYMEWKNYYATYKPADKRLLDQFRAAFLVHPFEPPFRW